MKVSAVLETISLVRGDKSPLCSQPRGLGMCEAALLLPGASGKEYPKTDQSWELEGLQFLFNIYLRLFIWLHWVLVAACEI